MYFLYENKFTLLLNVMKNFDTDQIPNKIQIIPYIIKEYLRNFEFKHTKLLLPSCLVKHTCFFEFANFFALPLSYSEANSDKKSDTQLEHILFCKPAFLFCFFVFFVFIHYIVIQANQMKILNRPKSAHDG